MKRLFALFIFLLTLPAFSQYGAVNGLCYFGSPQTFVPGATIPGVTNSCNVTVYNAGTFTPATIYSSSTGALLSNPFTIYSLGYWTFYASNSIQYDIVISGAYPPYTTLTPTTLKGVNTGFAGTSSAYVQYTPPSTQTIAQPPGTNFNVTTSGGGALEQNGIPVLTTSTGVQYTQPSSQTITQPSGTNFDINTSGGGNFLLNGVPISTAANSVLLSPGVAQTITQPVNTNFNVVTTGTGSFETNGIAVQPRVSPFDVYIAFGDSITFGYTADSRWSAYPQYIASYLNIPANNQGVVGSTQNSNTNLIFSESANGSILQTNTGLITYQIGTNDLANGAAIPADGNDANQAADFGLGIQAEMTFIATPISTHKLASSFAYTGTWTGGVFSPDRATSTSGNTATFTVTGGTIYLATVIQVAVNAASATLSCDGNATGATLMFSGVGGEALAVGSPQTALTRVTGLSNTTHTCVVTVTSTSGTVELSWAAGVSGSANPTFPYLLQGSIINQTPTNPTNIGLYRSQITSAVTMLNGDGLNVYLADNSASLTAPNNFNTSLHPDDYGYFLISQPYTAEIASLFPSYTNPVPQYYGALLVNAVEGGTGGNIIVTTGNNDVTFPAVTGQQNTFFGYTGNGILTSGSQNTSFGSTSCLTITTGIENTCVGDQTYVSGNGNSNVAVGQGSLHGSTGGTGSSNVALGASSMYELSTGNNNVCDGYNCDFSITTGSQNVASGWSAMQENTTGSSNVAIGSGAGGQAGNANANVSGNENTWVGAASGPDTTTQLSYSGALGDGALVGANYAYEIGAGQCNTANTLCFLGVPIANQGLGLIGVPFTTASLGGSLLTAGACSSITVTISGLTNMMDVHTTPQTYPGDGFWWEAYWSATNTATVKVCNGTMVSATPTAALYNVRVVQ